MREQCSTCSSYNEAGAAFCSQCGAPLEGPAKRARRRRHRRTQQVVIGTLLALTAAVIVLAYLPHDETAPKGTDTAARADDPGVTTEVTVREESSKPAAGVAPAPIEDDETALLSASQLEALARASLVVLELRNEEGRPIRDIRGVLVAADGVVLCRFRPLLGAYQGACRLSGSRDARVEILGVTHYDPLRDLALLRIDPADHELAALPLMEEAPARVFGPGDELYVFSGYRLKTGVIAEAYWVTARGVAGIRFAPEPVVVPETFMALDVYGYLVGLCRPVVGGQFVPEGEAVGGDDYRVFVDPAGVVLRHVDLPVVMTLYQLTTQLYEGTFDELATRAGREYRRKNWAEAIGLFERAVDRAAVEFVEEKRLAQVYGKLRESYLRELERLESAGRHTEASVLAGTALGRFPRDVTLWTALADARFALGLLREGIDALLEVKALEAGPPVESRLVGAYLELAAEALAAGNGRLAESVYIEGIEQIPRSGQLHLALGKLYQQWEFYDEAIRSLQAARELDRGLADQVEIYLDRIDDVLKRRDAVVIPIPGGSGLIRTQVVIDGRWEQPVVVDTGATHTTLPRKIAEELGYDIDRAKRVRVGTAGGVIQGWKIRLQSIDLQGYGVRNLEAIVLPDKAGPDMGLLGLNFLRFFKYSVDAERSEFRLERP